MRKLFFVFVLLCTVSLLFAQEKEDVILSEQLARKLEKVNAAFSKKIDRINKKLEKQLLKRYPQLEGINIDSLLDERVYRKSSLQRLHNSSLSMPEDSLNFIPNNGEPNDEILASTGFSDSTLIELVQLRESLLADSEMTPSALDVHQEMGESMSKLGKTEELLKSFNTPEFPELPNLQLPQLPKPDFEDLLSKADIKGLESGLKELTGLMDEYKLGFEGWEAKLLAEVSSFDDVKLFQSQMEKLKNHRPLPEGYRDKINRFQTNDFVKEKLQTKAEEIERVGGKSLQERFNEGQAKLTEAKDKHRSFGSVNDKYKRKPNPYKGDPFLKRLKVGGNFQTNRRSPTSIDAAFRVSYLLNQNARVGTGFSYRFMLQDRLTNIDFDDQVFSSQTFFDYTVFKSIYVEALYEWTNTDVLESENDIDTGRQWIQSGMLGIGNRFQLKKGLGGNVTILYNFFHDEKSPNPSPWVFRVGFEF